MPFSYKHMISRHKLALQVVDVETPFEGEPGLKGSSPVVYLPERETIYVGSPGSIHWGLAEKVPGLESELHYEGRTADNQILWHGEEPADANLVADALNAQTRPSPLKNWQFTEPQATEPSKHKDVQFSNDEPGVPTVGA